MKIYIYLLLFVLGYSVIFAQSEPDTTKTEKNEEETVPKQEDFDDFFKEDNNLESMDFFGGDLFGKRQSDLTYLSKSPTFEILWGVNSPTIHEDRFGGYFAETGLINVRLGQTGYRSLKVDTAVANYNFNYFGISNANIDFGSNLNNYRGIRTELWTISLGNQDGIGWRLGEQFTITPYSGGSLNFNFIDFIDSAQTIADQKVINRYGKSMRFGEQYEAGLVVRLNEYFNIKAEYGTSLVFPRMLFWKWALSGVVSGAAQGIASLFVEKIQERVPKVAPIANFVLMNAINYGMYEFRKKNMNWPANTEAPFAQEYYKIGLSITL